VRRGESGSLRAAGNGPEQCSRSVIPKEGKKNRMPNLLTAWGVVAGREKGCRPLVIRRRTRKKKRRVPASYRGNHNATGEKRVRTELKKKKKKKKEPHLVNKDAGSGRA